MIILRMPDVKQRTGLSRSQIYALIKLKKFPRQVELGKNSVGWLDSEVSSWIAGQVNKRIAKYPESKPGVGALL